AQSPGPLPLARQRERLSPIPGPLPFARHESATVYIELHTSSAFSFLDGASLPETLVERAAALDYPALALLDRDGVYGAPRFHLAAKKAGLKAIIGAELTLSVSDIRYPISDTRYPISDIRKSVIRKSAIGGSRLSDIGYRVSDAVFRLPVLIESQAGYKNL